MCIWPRSRSLAHGFDRRAKFIGIGVKLLEMQGRDGYGGYGYAPSYLTNQAIAAFGYPNVGQTADGGAGYAGAGTGVPAATTAAQLQPQQQQQPQPDALLGMAATIVLNHINAKNLNAKQLADVIDKLSQKYTELQLPLAAKIASLVADAQAKETAAAAAAEVATAAAAAAAPAPAPAAAVKPKATVANPFASSIGSSSKAKPAAAAAASSSTSAAAPSPAPVAHVQPPAPAPVPAPVPVPAAAEKPKASVSNPFAPSFAKAKTTSAAASSAAQQQQAPPAAAAAASAGQAAPAAASAPAAVRGRGADKAAEVVGIGSSGSKIDGYGTSAAAPAPPAPPAPAAAPSVKAAVPTASAVAPSASSSSSSAAAAAAPVSRPAAATAPAAGKQVAPAVGAASSVARPSTSGAGSGAGGSRSAAAGRASAAASSFGPAPKDALGGYIFHCSRDTYQECIDRNLFGGPRETFSDGVSQIHPGYTRLFLYDLSRKVLVGAFEAVDRPALNIVGDAWTAPWQGLDRTVGQGRTRYSSQVRVKRSVQFAQPLPRSVFLRHTTPEGFRFSNCLDKAQADAMMKAFQDYNKQ